MSREESEDQQDAAETPSELPIGPDAPGLENGGALDTTPDDPGAVEIPETRRHALREKAMLVSAKQKRARLIWRGAMILVIVAVIAAVALIVTNVVAGAAGKPQAEPLNMVDGGFVIDDSMVTSSTSAGNGTLAVPTTPTPTETAVDDDPATDVAPTAAPTPVDVRIYFDFHDPDAAAFQAANAKQLAQWVREDGVTLTYYPVATVTGQSNGTKYSQRAMSASVCVATHSPESVFAFLHELLAQQPQRETEAITDAAIADLAIAVGGEEPKKLRACIEDGTFMAWSKKRSDAVNGARIDGTDASLDTPFLVLVDDERYVGSSSNAAEFSQAILKAASDAFYATPSATPSPSETPADSTGETPKPTPGSTVPPVEASPSPAPGT